jgi:hypothetical protein
VRGGGSNVTTALYACAYKLLLSEILFAFERKLAVTELLLKKEPPTATP